MAQTQELAKRLGLAVPRVLSQRDVTGLSRGAIVPLVDSGVIGISIGANDGSPPPITPSTRDCYHLGLRQATTITIIEINQKKNDRKKNEEEDQQDE